MTSPPELLIRGTIVVEALPSHLETVEAILVRDGRVAAAGRWPDVASGASPAARLIDARPNVVIPGLHDFHVHLVGVARARGQLDLDGAADGAEILERVVRRAAQLGQGEWLLGRGWTEAAFAAVDVEGLEQALAGVPALLGSHDFHSAWASPALLALGGITAGEPDPAGGRIERDASGRLTGTLRETAVDLVAGLVPVRRGVDLRKPLDELMREMAGLGITGASEAGDFSAEGGIGPHADLGDSVSSLLELAGNLDGRLRLSLGIPVEALAAAAGRGLRTGAWLAGSRTIRLGWAKEFADGALGSGTAALTAPIPGGADQGILRVSAEELDALFAASRPAGIGLAIHAIGDRAARSVLDALERAPERPREQPADRMEHVQLLLPDDAARFAELRMTASVQPIHAAADRDLVDTQWRGREADAYAWRRLADAGALLAAGSDAPVESINPWLGMFAAVHRRVPDDPRDDWTPAEALTIAEAMRAYTMGPALAIGASDEGHLRAGARADLAILDVDLETLRAADERLASIRSTLTLVEGEEVPAT